MDVLPVSFASVPYVGYLVIQLNQEEFVSRGHERGRGRGARRNGGMVVGIGVVSMCVVCGTHHEPDPASASDPCAGSEFSSLGMPMIVTETPVVFKTIVLYLAEICSHVDHPGGGDPAPGAVREWVVVK